MRAACTALARARNPRLVLSGCVGQLGGARTLTPHGGGYQELLERIVEHIEDAPGEFAGIDRECVIVQQLDRLSEAEIRELAGRVLVDLGMQ